MHKFLLLPIAIGLIGAANPQTAPSTCSAPVAVPANIAKSTPNSTYYSSDEPPARFAHAPNHAMNITFGADEINRLCGKAPCGMVFLGCTRDNEMALPDPFETDPVQLAHIMRHEFAHVNGWPATHGD